MTFTKNNSRTYMIGDEENRVTALKELLGYPVVKRDPEGSEFWYLHPGEDEEEACLTCPIAVGFYEELNTATDQEIKRLFTSKEKQQEVYGHYSNREFEQQPVMYLLLPTDENIGRIPLVLPTEGGLRQRQIQTFGWNDAELIARLNRLKQEELTVATKALYSIPQVDWVFYEAAKTAGELASSLAEAARRIEQAIPKVFAAESSDGYLHKLLKSFQRELLPTLQLTSDNQKDYSFADIYAQTVAYGLFTARVFSYVRDKKEERIKETDFNRQDAWKQLPQTNPFLRRLFEDVSQQTPEELGDELIGAISDIFGILRAAKMDAILSDFKMKMKRKDIVIRFYEDFLAAYKPQMRERRGVYYTPEPVVSYMVRSVDVLLKEKFNKPLGLADPEVMILDPACGTGTFLLWICQLIHKRFQENPDLLTEGLEDKSWSGYVKERLLPRIFGFELLMAPYAIAHLKLGLFLEETGYKFDDGKRLEVYLTNALEQDAPDKPEIPFQEFIAAEGEAALEVKQSQPIMVVVGNPPYSISSANKGVYIENLMDIYKSAVRNERNIQPLSDDYVKFIRFAHERIGFNGYGIISMITNHSYLNGLVHRGMREELLKSFNCIYALNAHGNISMGEQSPDGTLDENIFDIRQGTAVSFYISNSNIRSDSQVNSFDLWGIRNHKYQYLENHDVSTTNWEIINPISPYFFLEPKNFNLDSEYQDGWKITNIFPINSNGLETGKDESLITFLPNELREVINDLVNPKISNIEIYNKYGIKDTSGWNFSLRRPILIQEGFKRELITPIYSKPFDINYTYYHNFLRRPQSQVLRHLLQENIALLAMRQVVSGNADYTHFGVTNTIVDNRSFHSNRGRPSIFPLYIYPDNNEIQKLVLKEQRSPNLSPEFLKDITSKLGYTPTPEAIFYYIYAIFHSPTYRIRYAEFLKIDFPRVPLISNKKLFQQLSEYGEELVALHLMKSPKLDNLITQFVENGGGKEVAIGAANKAYANNKVTINKKGDGFTGIPEEVWNFHVGGYQVCHKWLKDRKNRTLSQQDIQHYQRIVVALQETIKLMNKIDQAIPEFPIT
ncbi:MAG: type ISP restriction/modification enzyme [Rivularia sp. (in: cyanobacteria)]